MTDSLAPPASPPPPAPRPPWGYFSSFGWVVLAHVLSAVAGLAAVALWQGGLLSLTDLDALAKDAALFSLSSLAALPVLIGVLFWAVRERGWPVSDYLALAWPSRREIVIALVALVAFLPALDAAAYLAGQPVVTPFQIDLYRSAEKSGALVLLWLALVIAAPVGEEIMFRGFLYRGWVRSPRGTVPGILAISAFFGILHIQYNWFGMLQVCALGLLLAWTRWRSGSTLMTIVMHAITNFYATVQTVVALKWLS